MTGDSPVKAAEAMKPAPMGGAGCDGHGAPATCSTCSGSSCEQVCVGYNECVIRYENGHPSCVSQGSCTGGGFGAGGGFTWIP